MTHPLTAELCSTLQHVVNTKMSEVCVSVSHNWKDITQDWASQDYVRIMKLRKVPMSLPFQISVLLTNVGKYLHQDVQIKKPRDRCTLTGIVFDLHGNILLRSMFLQVSLKAHAFCGAFRVLQLCFSCS